MRKGGWIALFVALGAPVVVAAVLYLAAWAFFLSIKTMPTYSITPGTWLDLWERWGSDPEVARKLKGALGIAAGFGVGLPGVALLSALQQRRSLHGDARFATATEVRESGLMGEQGIIVGKFAGRHLVVGNQQFAFVAAPTRSGKGVGVVIPNLLNWPGSIVVLDIKLENWSITSRFRAEHGQAVYLFAPFAEDQVTHRWNPLDQVSRDPTQRVGDLFSIAQVLYPSGGKQDPFWSEQARNLFLGLALYVMETPGLPLTLGELLRQSSGKGMPVKAYVQQIMAERSSGPTPLSDACLDALNRFAGTSENTLASILATFNGPLTIFANPIVDAATSASDFDISQIRRQRMSIYFGLQPNRLADGALLANLFFSQLVHQNTRTLPQNHPDLKYEALLLMDEFTALGRVSILASAVGYIAGYGLRLLVIVQSISQLESVYGDKDAQTLMTNHACQILFPPREQRDAKAYSEMLGYYGERAVSRGTSRSLGWGGDGRGSRSENVSEQRRAVLLPQELKELPQTAAIVVYENTRPVMAEKAMYYRDRAMVSRLQAVSPTLQECGSRLPTHEQLTRAAFVVKDLSAPAPRLDLEAHRAMVEHRVRPATPGEAIDIGRLALDVAALPPITDQTNPAADEIEALCDRFFEQLDWATPAVAAPAVEVGSVDQAANGGEDGEWIDLSVLDKQEAA